MSNWWIAFLFALGVSAWIFNIMSGRTGGEAKTALTVAATVGALVLVALLILLSLLSRN